MISNGIEAFSGKNVLLLQGPIGPFFSRLAYDLRQAGATVHKVNFNGGDWLFYPTGAISFNGSMDEWPRFLGELLDTHAIDTVLLFGDMRPIHRSVSKLLKERKVRVGVFEEGYIRPDYVTLELDGANGNSSLPRDPQLYFEHDAEPVPPPKPVRNAFRWMGIWATLYYVASALFSPLYPRYRHHRPLTLTELGPWILSAWRKYRYRIKEKGLQEQIVTEYDGRYFLVPLQVHNDSQLYAHSDFDSVWSFIEDVVVSFERYAPEEAVLVFKHHPMDRGYYDYGRFLQDLTKELGLDGRLIYLHDQHLPPLLKHAKGVVLINSTVGLSALHHRCPLKVCGTSIYDLPGLTFQGSLDEFWRKAPAHKPDPKLYASYRDYLIRHTQLNGSFYTRFEGQRHGTGLVWSENGRNGINHSTGSVLLNSSITAQLGSIRTKIISNKLFLFNVLVPTLLSILYFGLVKSDVYVSESHFIIRAPQKQMATGLEAVLQGVGFSNSGDDTHSIHDYMQSRDAAQGIDKAVNLRRVFGNTGIDLFSRYNPLGFNDSFEELYRHYQQHVSVYLNASSAISVLKVKAYDAEDAYRINELLLSKGEGLINQLNERAREDLISHARSEVELAEKKAKTSSINLAAFRNKYAIVDPINQSALQLQHVSKLQDEYIATKTRLAQVQRFTPQSPQIPILQSTLATLKSEIDSETGKVAGSDPSLANKAVDYERLLLEQKFAEKQLAAAMTSLEQARSEAQRKQLYLERIVQPNKPDIATEPDRAWAILTTLLVGLIFWGILSMLIAGVKEHHD
jgi:BexC/CtrB/KpsE family polysaccharide export inner-membrane protein